MPGITIMVGALLVIQGVGFFVAASFGSITAMIPTFLGVPILVLGILAFKESARKHAMHLTAVLATLGCLAAVGRMASAGLSVSAAGVSLIIMATLTGGLLLLCIQSFVSARRRQRNPEQ